MADYATLKAAIQAVIYENGNQEITGSVMQATLLAMVNSLGANYQYAGIATPSTNPGTPDQNVFYLASTAGTYVNFGNIVLAENEVAILKYNGSWTKETSGFASEEIVNQLNTIINGDSKTVTLAVTAGTGVTYNNSLRECRLYKGRTYRIVLSGVINAITMYFRNANNSESINVNYRSISSSGIATNIGFNATYKEYIVTPSADVFYVRFYSGASNITNTGNMVWDFVSEGIAEQAVVAFEKSNQLESRLNSNYPMFKEIVPISTKNTLVTPSTSRREAYDASGNLITSSLYTYYYSVLPGQIYKIVGSPFSSANMSIVSLLNGATFVKSIVLSPVSNAQDYYFAIPDGVDKLAVTYWNNNVFVCSSFSEDIASLVSRLNQIDPIVGEVENNIAQTRNISPLPVNIEVPGTGIVFGTQGVTLLPVGRYELSFEMASESYTLDAIGYFTGVSGGVNIINQQGASAGRIVIGWNFDHPLERILFKTHSGAGSISLSNIQIETIAWDGYTSSPNKGDWAPLPYATPYIPKQTLLDDVAREFANSYWRGKKINYNGDSITQGIGTSRVGYVKVVNQLLQFGTVRNYAIGGTRLAHVSDVVNCLVDRIEEMSTDADVVFIMANTNDYASQVPIGASDSTDESTYNGALNSIFGWLKENYPTQPIIISTMLTRKVNYADNEPLPITIEQYAEAVRQKVAEYGFILYDAYKWSGLDLLNTPKDGTGVSDDGLHPNEAGALALGRKVAKFIDAQ